MREAGGRAAHTTLAKWAKTFIVVALLFVILRAFLVDTFIVTSDSMENTLQMGDMFVVNRAAMGSRIPFTSVRIPGYGEPHRGDVLVFDPPPSNFLSVELVKRLIGMPGDTLEMRNRVVYVDGKAQDEPYVHHTDVRDERHFWMEWQKKYLLPGVDPHTYSPTRDNWGPLVVPDGRYFMMGDNREASLDSRYWGPVGRSRLRGRAVSVYFSYKRQSHGLFPWLTQIRWGRIGESIH